MTARRSRHLIGADELDALLRGGRELAILDAREQGAFSTDHLFWGSCVPLSRLELLVADLVPRRTAPVVWVDADGAPDGLAARAAARLGALGWSDVRVLAGGVQGWPGERYSGVNVPSKAFGEWVERVEGTPHVSAVELSRRKAAGERLVILDSRPMREFRQMSIPGGIDCPGAELAYRVHGVVPDDTTTVVVNCAGRTRSIIGAQSLRNAGIPNPVLALEHGTMGWELAGLHLAHGETAHAPVPVGDALERAVAAGERVAERFGVRTVDAATVTAWLADLARTTYVLDVRTPEEYAAGHAPFARHAPGGQVVQAADEYVGVLGARVVLVDDGSLVRARLTASWLHQLGRYEAVVADLDGVTPVAGVTAPATVGVPDIVPSIGVDELDGEELVIDLADSRRYRRGHLPGALWAVRSRFDEAVGDTAALLGDAGRVVLTSPDGVLARAAWSDAEAHWPGVRVLRGGTAAWTTAGGSLEEELRRPTTTTDDVWYKPYDAEDEAVARKHMEDYLRWEVELLRQIDRDHLVTFVRA